MYSAWDIKMFEIKALYNSDFNFLICQFNGGILEILIYHVSPYHLQIMSAVVITPLCTWEWWGASSPPL